MRPVKLTMQAFGPYPGREIVDFRRALEGGLFGIYGPTGSGKSTILSAVTFALFGEATKVDQETASLRSHHADPNMSTEVEFVFDVAERRFVVRRCPEQTRPKQRGGGETKSVHEAWLFDATGLAVEEISKDHSGRILAERKTGAVQQAVVDLLGYGPEQFRQIVLLPQGKFETFLAAKTNDRLKILRELFDVSTYQRLAASFKENADSAEKEVKLKRDVCAARLRTEGFDSADALSIGIMDAQGQHEELLKREVEATTAVDAARGRLDAGRKLEELFVAAEDAKTELAKLLATECEIASLDERIKMARRAQALVDVEGYFNEAALEVVELAKKLAETQSLAAKAIDKANVSIGALKAEREREHEIVDLRKHCDDLARYHQTLADAADLDRHAKDASNILYEAQKEYDRVDQHHNDLLGQKSSQEQALKSARENERTRGDRNKTLVSLNAALKDAEQFEKAVGDLKACEIKATRLKAELDDAVSLANGAKARFDSAEANLAVVQALHLAAKLTPGEACPVCGSCEHPAPANGQIENSGLEQAFRNAKKAWQQAQKAQDDVSRDFALAEGALRVHQDRFEELSRPEQSAASVLEQVGAVTDQIAALGAVIDVDTAERQLEELAKKAIDAEEKRESARNELESAKQAGALMRDRYKQALSAIPEEFREQNALDAALASARRTLAAREVTLEKAIEADRIAREQGLSATKDAEAAKSSYDQSIGRRDKTEAIFRERLVASLLTEQSYQSFKASIPMIESDTQKVEEYRSKLELARRDKENAEQAISQSERPDFAPLETALRVAEEAQKRETDSRAEIGARLSHLQNLRSEIDETLIRLQEFETRTAPLRTLSALFNAGNALRLDLETYAIGAMFGHVLRAANLRLGPMTNGRYALERDNEEASGRSRRGLGINVFDLHTGRPRPPSTLSGGETFIVALALALGLSDVVESVSGKVHLDTIFIDEGFGSLDTENESGTLDQVLQVLTNLVSQRRAVGVISHVPMVQNAIPNGFYVRKDLRGSRIEVRELV
jgi:DNA repair protein SbcC/Rad50